MYVFTNIFRKVKIVQNNFDELNFYLIFQLSQLNIHILFFYNLLLLLTTMRINIKHITLLYLFNYCIYCFYDILYALIDLTKTKTKRTI